MCGERGEKRTETERQSNVDSVREGGKMKRRGERAYVDKQRD